MFSFSPIFTAVYYIEKGFVNITPVRVSTPGRVCLFGEHQDYLHLPVISAAISLRIQISGFHWNQQSIHINAPDVNQEHSFSLQSRIPYERERDYFKSSVNVLLDEGFTFSKGMQCKVKGEIPIAAGTSSSTAMVVSWIQFLARMSDQQTELTPAECARLAFKAEVTEFQEPGGTMDQYATALGGILFQSFDPVIYLEPLNASLSTFVLGDSLTPKDTKSILSRVKEGVLKTVYDIKNGIPTFSLQTITLEQLDDVRQYIDDESFALLQGTIRNRDLTGRGLELFRKPHLDEAHFGVLLNEQQAILRDILKISTQKIDSMLDAACEAGARGGKINGSGGGGCMFVYAPEKTEEIAEAIERVGGKAYIVHVDTGTMVETTEDETHY